MVFDAEKYAQLRILPCRRGVLQEIADLADDQNYVRVIRLQKAGEQSDVNLAGKHGLRELETKCRRCNGFGGPMRTRVFRHQLSSALKRLRHQIIGAQKNRGADRELIFSSGRVGMSRTILGSIANGIISALVWCSEFEQPIRKSGNVVTRASQGVER